MKKYVILIIIINCILINYVSCNEYFYEKTNIKKTHNLDDYKLYGNDYHKLYDNRKKKFKTYLYFLKKYQNHIHATTIKKHIISMYLKYENYDLENIDLFDLTINQFIQSHSESIYIDFLIYIQGMVYKKYDKNFSKCFFCIKKIDSNPKYAYLALKSFKKIINYYPNSVFFKDAKKFIFILNERIADYHLKIIHFYIKKNAQIAYYNRILEVISNFPNTKASNSVLKYLK
ncbi:MAG: outer membrane protein assembly factor BamD [Wigglesworthia glossinidia]|nr:outer membrane protein assembly factor BamD [Wigglesworthia glossinidia]